MGHAACELPDRLHPGGLCELRLDLALARDVTTSRDTARVPPGSVADQAHGDRLAILRAVLAPPEDLPRPVALLLDEVADALEGHGV